jgi:NAD(P)-dependent dehydrogenase (short-subunit alcohol dehydrogenase family)
LRLLESKTVVITGGSLGIGYEVARKCVKEGARVIISARNKGNLKKALSNLRKISGKDHKIYPVDVSQYQAVRKFAGWTAKQFPFIGGLVNCAGIYGPIGRINQIDIGKFEEAIQINFLGTVNMCHAFFPLFNKANRKKIINFSGGGAASPFPNFSAYATSKIAIVRFTENLALELAESGFDVNCIAPGFVITRLHQQTIEAGPNFAGEAFFDNTKKQIQSGGVPAEKAAALAAFLLSPASDGITGKFISAPWDPWQESDFQEKLRSDKDFATLRRIDDKNFFKKI